MTKAGKNGSSAIRDYVASRYVEDAKRKSLRRFSVNAGEVHRSLGLQNRVPQVCNALQSSKFLNENGLRIVEKTGPPSGLSTSVTITYEIAGNGRESNRGPDLDAFLALRGIAKEIFASFGGGEAFIHAEREAWRKRTGESER
jgi:hypothetical protein